METTDTSVQVSSSNKNEQQDDDPKKESDVNEKATTNSDDDALLEGLEDEALFSGYRENRMEELRRQ